MPQTVVKNGKLDVTIPKLASLAVRSETTDLFIKTVILGRTGKGKGKGKGSGEKTTAPKGPCTDSARPGLEGGPSYEEG